VRIVVSGASGFVGRPLLEHLRAHGHEVLQLVRRLPRTADEVEWDPAAGTIDTDALQGVQAAVNLSGAGVGDKRWTSEYKRVLRDSRVDSSRTLATALASLSPRPTVLLQASGMDYYGDTGDEVVSERFPRGDGFLADVCEEWEAAARPAQDAGIRVAHLRTSLVLGRDGGSLGRLLPLYKLGLGGPMGRGRMWWSWITLPDMLAVVEFLLTAEVDGPVNVAAPDPVRNKEFTAALAKALHRPALAPVPPPALRIVLGEFAENVMASHRLAPQVLLDAGFRFEHPDLASAVGWVTSKD
jgi:uncharacterized protein (TIGR01777 family)